MHRPNTPQWWSKLATFGTLLWHASSHCMWQHRKPTANSRRAWWNALWSKRHSVGMCYNDENCPSILGNAGQNVKKLHGNQKLHEFCKIVFENCCFVLSSEGHTAWTRQSSLHLGSATWQAESCVRTHLNTLTAALTWCRDEKYLLKIKSLRLVTCWAQLQLGAPSSQNKGLEWPEFLPGSRRGM